MRNRFLRGWSNAIVSVLFLSWVCHAACAQQNTSLVLETANTEATVGGRIVMRVRTNGVSYRHFHVVGLLGMHRDYTATTRNVGSDLEITLSLSRLIPIGPFDYSVTAETENGEEVQSNTISVPIEAWERMTDLRAPGIRDTLNNIGREQHFNIIGIGESKSEYYLSDSSRISISSSNPSIVSVERMPNTLITRGAGTTSIRIEYKEPEGESPITLEIPITVKVGMKGDFNRDGKVNVSDLRRIMARVQDRLGRVIVPGDTMDLNNDRVVDTRDIWEVARLCTFDNCGYWDGAVNPGRPTPTPLSFQGTPYAVGRSQRNPATPTPTPTPFVRKRADWIDAWSRGTPVAGSTPTMTPTSIVTPTVGAVSTSRRPAADRRTEGRSP